MIPAEFLKIGTCSWKYESWVGILYSGSAGVNYLKEYSEHFPTVEIDQWFWSLYPGDKVVLPKEETVLEYASSVPEDFRFSVKVPNSITLTHHYSKDKGAPLVPNPHFLSEDLFLEFLRRLDPMKPNLGPLMFQFEYLNKQKMASQAEFLDRLDGFLRKCPEGYLYSVETRNPNYLNDRYFTFLRTRHVYPVFLQGYYMPSLFPIYEQFKNDLKDLAVVRMHGPDRKGMEEKTNSRWDRIIEPRDEELSDLAAMIQDMAGRKMQVYVNVNNHYEGSAPLTIQRIKELLSRMP
jgi:uncharacterized protein YecE (DUF72 family)